MNADPHDIIWTYLGAQAALTAVVPAERIMSPRLRKKTILPAIGFFIRGGVANPHIEEMVEPSVQFDCWADSADDANGAHDAYEVYLALFDVLQGKQNQNVTVGGNTYQIKFAVEEVQGQVLQDIDIPDRFRVLTFFRMMIRPVTV